MPFLHLNDCFSPPELFLLYLLIKFTLFYYLYYNTFLGLIKLEEKNVDFGLVRCKDVLIETCLLLSMITG